MVILALYVNFLRAFKKLSKGLHSKQDYCCIKICGPCARALYVSILKARTQSCVAMGPRTLRYSNPG